MRNKVRFKEKLFLGTTCHLSLMEVRLEKKLLLING